MTSRYVCGILAVLAVLLCSSSGQLTLEELLENEVHTRHVRQTPSVDTCVLGCILNTVRNVGMGNIRPATWTWSLSDILQSAVLRTYCDAYGQAMNCIQTCSLSGSKLLVSALMGIPGLLCTGSAGANECLRNATNSVKNTCSNKCGDLKPSFGMQTWLSLSKMTNIFNDMCAYWGCQLACAKPAVDRNCGQESVSLYNRITSIGFDTLKNALKSAGLASVCGANATRIPQTFEIRTDSPIDDGGQGQGGGGTIRPGGIDGDDNRPPTDSQEGGDGDGWGQGGQGGGHGGGQGGGQGGGEQGISLGGGGQDGHGTRRPGSQRGGQDGGQQRGGFGSRSTTTERSSGGWDTFETSTRSGGRRGGTTRAPSHGRGRWTTTTMSDFDEGTHLGNEDYWNTLSSSARGGRGGHATTSRPRGNFGGNNDDDDTPTLRHIGSSSRGQRGTTLPNSAGLGDLNQKRRPMRLTTTESSSDSYRDAGRELPTMRVRDTDQRTGEVHVKLGD